MVELIANTWHGNLSGLYISCSPWSGGVNGVSKHSVKVVIFDEISRLPSVSFG